MEPDEIAVLVIASSVTLVVASLMQSAVSGKRQPKAPLAPNRPIVNHSRRKSHLKLVK